MDSEQQFCTAKEAAQNWGEYQNPGKVCARTPVCTSAHKYEVESSKADTAFGSNKLEIEKLEIEFIGMTL